MGKTKEEHAKDLEALMADHKTKGTRPKFQDLAPEHQELILEALKNTSTKKTIVSKVAPTHTVELKPITEGGM